jgi:hypothetical protein
MGAGLLAREESGPCAACPGGARSWMDQDSIVEVSCLPGRKVVRALACPGGGLARESFLGFHTKSKSTISQRAVAG